MTIMRFNTHHYNRFEIYTMCIIFDNYMNNHQVIGKYKKIERGRNSNFGLISDCLVSLFKECFID